MNDPAQAAAALTEAQRTAILGARWHSGFATIDALPPHGLTARFVYMFTLRSDRLTPFGEQVRAHLLTQEPTHG